MTLIARLLAVIAVAAALLAGPAAFAARVAPEPVLAQLEQGYGIAEAEVIHAARLEPAEKSPVHYSVTFKIADVLANVSAGPGLKTGDPIVLKLAVGYSAEVEDWSDGNANAPPGPFTPGSKFYLTVRRSADGTFEHAPGASAAIKVERFDPAEKQLVTRLALLAALPADRRLNAELNVVADPQAPDKLRLALIAAIDHSLRRDEAFRSKRELVLQATQQVWSDPRASLSPELITAIDYLLRSNSPDWSKSDSRRRVMLDHVFTPFPKDPAARETAVRERDKVAWFLRDYLADWPNEAGPAIAERMTDERWPAQFRWRLAGSLQYAYQTAAEEHSDWADALRRFYPGAIEAADAWVLRLLCSNLEMGTTVQGRRRFIAGPRAREALAHALEKQRKAAGRPDADANAGPAVSSIERTLKALDDPVQPTPAR